jgi:hypothetical protein
MSQEPTPPARVLLCLHEECYGSFYMPLDYDESQTCPVDRRHSVAVYGDLIIRRYCGSCGDELGLARAGRELCTLCEKDHGDG